MSHLVAVVLVVTLALVPATGAQVRANQQEESFSISRWFRPLWGALDWLLERIPAYRSTSQKVGGMIDPSGITGPPAVPAAVPNGKGIASQNVGGMIDPVG